MLSNRSDYRLCKFRRDEFDVLVLSNEHDFLYSAFEHVKRNKILYARLAFMIAYSMFISSNPTMIFALNPCDTIEAMGNGAISVVQLTGIKILTIGMILELIREGMRGGSHNASSIITRYALLIAGVLFAPKFVKFLKTFVDSY